MGCLQCQRFHVHVLQCDFRGPFILEMSESAKWYSIYHAKAHLSNGWQGVRLPEHVLQNPAKIFPEKIHLESFFLLHPTTFNQAHVLRCLELKRKPKWMNASPSTANQNLSATG